jgi:hypothetical protein
LLESCDRCDPSIETAHRNRPSHCAYESGSANGQARRELIDHIWRERSVTPGVKKLYYEPLPITLPTRFMTAIPGGNAQWPVAIRMISLAALIVPLVTGFFAISAHRRLFRGANYRTNSDLVSGLRATNSRQHGIIKCRTPFPAASENRARLLSQRNHAV